MNQRPPKRQCDWNCGSPVACNSCGLQPDKGKDECPSRHVPHRLNSAVAEGPWRQGFQDSAATWRSRRRPSSLPFLRPRRLCEPPFPKLAPYIPLGSASGRENASGAFRHTRIPWPIHELPTPAKIALEQIDMPRALQHLPYIIYTIYIYVPVASFAGAGVPPVVWVSPWKAEATPCIMLATTLLSRARA